MWTKLGDEFPDEARDLSDGAFRTLVEAWCWSNRRLLDLTIDQRDLKRFAEADKPDAAVDELLETGWWQDLGDGRWFIGCRFSEWQRDRSQVEHRREQLALAQKRRRRHLVGDHSLCLNCKASDESTVDAADDYGDDPGRDGTGRVRDSNDATEEKGTGSAPALASRQAQAPKVQDPDVRDLDFSAVGQSPTVDRASDSPSDRASLAQPLPNSPNFAETSRSLGTDGRAPCRGCHVPKESWILASRDGYCITCYQTARLESA